MANRVAKIDGYITMDSGYSTSQNQEIVVGYFFGSWVVFFWEQK